MLLFTADLRQVPDNLVNLILDTLVTRPACEVQLAVSSGLSYNP
jgi:hypothetical protein